MIQLRKQPLFPIPKAMQSGFSPKGWGLFFCGGRLLTRGLYASFLYYLFYELKIDPIYGCVTTGDDWKFMKLENNVIYADKKTYYLGEIEELLGAFQTIIDHYKKQLN